jgi:hypothetical protein
MLKAAVAVAAVVLASSTECTPSKTASPTDNPVETLYGAGNYSWSASINWNCTFNVADFGGDFSKAQDAAVSAGGGVVFFPAGTYKFDAMVELQSGVVIRGEPTTARALDGTKPGPLAPKTVFQCPDRQHIGIQNADAKATNLGVVNVDLDGCAVMLWPALEGGSPTPSFKNYWYAATSVAGAGSNKIVLSNRIRNVNLGNPNPDSSPMPQPGEMWPWRFSTAIGVYVQENALVANNLVAKATLEATTSILTFKDIPCVGHGRAARAARGERRRQRDGERANEEKTRPAGVRRNTIPQRVGPCADRHTA